MGENRKRSVSSRMKSTIVSLGIAILVGQTVCQQPKNETRKYQCSDNYNGKRVYSEDVKVIKEELIEKLFKNRFDRYAHTLRLAFHDCVEGCDGCINRNNPGNFGPMLATLEVMDEMYDEKVENIMSRADFYQLTAITALEQSLKFNNKNLTSNQITPVDFVFKYGRCDCATSPYSQKVFRFPDTIIDFPGGNLGHNGVFNFFRKEFGLNKKLATALMGAHTLGGAAGPAASGFQGFWKEGQVESFRFNNRYYQLLVDNKLNWKNIDQSTVTGFPRPRWQWQAGTVTLPGSDGLNEVKVPAPFMLNADVVLFKNIVPNAEGKSACEFRDCPPAPTAEFVQEYASNGNRWIKDFAKAFRKMTERGSAGLKVPRRKPRLRL